MAKKIVPVISYDPKWRYKQQYKTNIKDKFFNLYKRFKSTGKPITMKEAVAIDRDSFLRTRLETLLLSGFTEEECARYYGVDERVIHYFCKIFFDIDPIFHSKPKLMQIARDSSTEQKELVAKIGAVRFGKEYIKFSIGLYDEIDENYVDNCRERVYNGLIIKSLSHELVGCSKDEMKGYIDILKNVNNVEIGKGIKESAEDMMSHFAKFFEPE